MSDRKRPRVRVLVNPLSGRGRAGACIERLRALAAPAGAEVVITDSVEDLRTRSAQAVNDGIDRLAIAGGDGTLHHAVQVLAGSDCSLGIVPLGSCNDLAAAVGIDRDPDMAMRKILHGTVVKVDLGSACDKTYAGVAGIGFDGEVARMVNEEVRWLPGPLAFPYAAIRTLLRFRPPMVSIEHDRGKFEGRVYFAVLANSPRFGGGMRIAPDARLDDGMLDLVIVRQVPRSTFLLTMPRVYSGRHVEHPCVETLRTRKALISTDAPLTVYGDGEPMFPVGGAPVRFSVRPGALSLVT